MSGPQPGMAITDRVRLVRELARGGMGAVWVARHSTLDVEVAVKFLLVDDPARRERLAREARLGARVDHPNAVRVYDHGVTADGLPFLVMELLNGVTLAERIERGPLPLPEVQKLLAQLGGALDAAHRAGVLHRDVKPSNVILVRGPLLSARLVDFGIARAIDGGDGTLTAVGQIVGTTYYLAPEQLLDGLPPDVRADLWGLAVLAYEALAGRRPYGGANAASVGAAMVLRRYDPITSVDASLPPALDGWFDRVLHLDPRERPGSAVELLDTFERAAGAVGVGVARRASAVFRLPSRIHGREGELGALGAAWDRVLAVGSRLLVIRGWSGIGKTALVDEFLARLGSAVPVVSGKFDLYDRGAPYRGLVPVLKELVRRAAADPARRERVATAIGDAGAALSALVEGTEALLGPAEEWPAPTGTERRAQLKVAVERLVGAVARADRPFVAFLDDLQWADPPTLDLVASLVASPDSPPVLWLATYRSSEVQGDHPLVATLDALRARDALDEVDLAPITEDVVLDIVSDAFPDSPGRIRLAAVCHARTRGNPFFLRRFLENLVETRIVAFDHAVGQWRWDVSHLDATPLSDDVVAFVASEIGRMSPEGRQAVAVAACVGDPFDLELVARALSCDRSAALDRLASAIATDLVVAVGRSTSGGESGVALRFRFSHDRVRQAARGLLDADAAAAVHRKVARTMLDHLSAPDRERRLFEIVDHLDRGFPDGVPDEDRTQVGELQLQAARRAARSAAFEVADHRYAAALACRHPDTWTTDPRGTAAITVEAARAAAQANRHERTEALAAEVADRAPDLLDRAAAREVLLTSLLARQRFAEGLRLAGEVLAELDAPFPAAPTPADVEAAVVGTMAALTSFGQADLEHLPVSVDPWVQARQRIRIAAMSTAYMAAPSVLPILACDIVRSTLADGTTRESPYGFAALGLVQNAAGLYEAAHGTGRIAGDLLDRVPDRTMRPRVRHLLAAHVSLFAEPLRDCVEMERDVGRSGLDAGDLEYAAWGLHGEVCNGFYAGIDLQTLGRTTERNLAAIRHHGQLAARDCTVQYERAIARLTGSPYDGPGEAEWLAEWRARNFRGAVFVTHTVGAFLRFVEGDAAGAAAFADEGELWADGAAATYHLVWWHQFRALAHLAAHGAAAVPLARKALEQLQGWQRVSAANHDHRVHLVSGELARVAGRNERALAHFDEAVASAVVNGFVAEEAVAHELAARCDPGFRSERLRRAAAAWTRWGASARARALASPTAG